MSLFDALRNLFKTPPVPDRPYHGLRERSVQCIGPHGLHRMAYTEWGDKDNPRVLICAHGLTRNGVPAACGQSRPRIFAVSASRPAVMASGLGRGLAGGHPEFFVAPALRNLVNTP